MRLHRFFVEGELKIGEDFVLENENQKHQILKVFRLGVGDKVILFDGRGSDFVSSIKSAAKEKIIFEVNEKKEGLLFDKKINLFLAIIRKERFEWAVEKATELGAASITPVITERVEHTHLNIERLKKIVVEASEQCGRVYIPEIFNPVDLKNIDFERSVLVADFVGEDIKNIKSEKEIDVFIGPEGGWTDAEREFFKQKNAKIVSLGKTILRAETASLVALVAVSI